MTLQQRECLCAEVCQQAMRDWRAGKIGNQELIWLTWQAQQRYGVGEVEACSNLCRCNPNCRTSGRHHSMQGLRVWRETRLHRMPAEELRGIRHD